MKFDGVWRRSQAESHDYPGLCVHDGRVTGSITTGCSRLPLWCFITTALTEGWPAVEDNWSPGEHYQWDASRLGIFLYYLLEQRGEFGRLLCVLADAERRSQRADGWNPPWWRVKTQRRRVLAALRRCVAALEVLDSIDASSS